MPDLADEILLAASEPLSSSGDGQSATGHNLKDLIEADKYLNGATNAGTNGTGFNLLRAARIIPPGAGPD